MAIKQYKKEISPGIFETRYVVNVDIRNVYTGKRTQRRISDLPSRPKAERALRELWSKVRNERPDGVNFNTWEPLLDRYVHNLQTNIRSENNPQGYSPSVVQTRISILRRTEVWGKMHLDLVTPHFVNTELNKLEQNGVTRAGTNHLLKEIKCVFTFALGLGAIKSNTFAGTKLRRVPKKRKEALNHAETQLLLTEAKKRKHPYYQIWLLTVALGLRRSELAGLKWIDIDFEQRLVYLRRQLIPNEGIVDFLKDKEERVVAIPAFLMETLREMRLRSNTDFVIKIKCWMWNNGQQSKALREFCQKIGIKEVTHHQLRATHITLALVDGVPLGVVKENVGHAKLSTTDMYFRSSGIAMKGQMDALNLSIPEINEEKTNLLKIIK